MSMPSDKIIAVREETESGIKTETRVGPDANTELKSLNLKDNTQEEFVKEVNRKLKK